jgi:hypothetical protein
VLHDFERPEDPELHRVPASLFHRRFTGA